MYELQKRVKVQMLVGASVKAQDLFWTISSVTRNTISFNTFNTVGRAVFDGSQLTQENIRRSLKLML